MSVFTNRFPKRLEVGAETIGVEPEILAVDKTGKAVSWDVVSRVFNEFITDGWTAVYDSGTNEIVGVEKKVNGSSVAFGTDVGYAIIEAQLPPAKTIQEALAIRSTVLLPLVTAFERQNAYLLGYGVLPIDKPRQELRAPKGRYVFFERDSTNEYIPVQDGKDLHFFTMSAAAHTHFGIDQNRVIAATNALNMLGGVFLTLGANSPVWKGEIDPQGNRAVREWFWDAGWGKRRPRQIGILPHMNSLADYVEHLASFEPQMIKIGNEYLSLVGSKKTVKELISNKKAYAYTVNGERKEVPITPEYILFVGGFAWYAARPAWPGTVESRISCQQPPHTPLCMAALALGIICNLENVNMFVQAHRYPYWKQLRSDALYQGFSHPDMTELCTKVLKLAKSGLKKRGFGEEIFLEEIEKRFKDKKAPAEIVLEKFNRDGIDGLIEYTRISTDSLKH